MRPPAIFFATAVLAAAGCVSTRRVAIGPPVPARPYGCDIAFGRLDPNDAARRLRLVGTVCVAGGGASDGVDRVYARTEAREALQEDACELGGELVSPIGLCSNGRVDGLEFGVYRDRE
jgi:hypothetical protein